MGGKTDRERASEGGAHGGELLVLQATNASDYARQLQTLLSWLANLKYTEYFGGVNVWFMYIPQQEEDGQSS